MVQTLTHTTQNTHTKSTPEPKNNATTILIMPIQSVKVFKSGRRSHEEIHRIL